MKKILSFIVIALNVFAFYSCNDSIDPYADYKQEFVLNCILNGDSSFQVATLSSTYRGSSLNPYTNTTDPAVAGALIRVWWQDSVAIFRDSTIARFDSSHYTTPYKFYYVKNFIPRAGINYEIEAQLQDGQKVGATLQPPSDIQFETSANDTLLPMEDQKHVNVRWKNFGDNTVYISRIVIYYYMENTGKKRYEKYVPQSYTEYNGGYLAVEPEPGLETACTVDYTTVNRAMTEIAGDDFQKSKYQIISAFVEVYALSEQFSHYYASTHRMGADYSVVLDEPDLSNVQGGLGIFGMYLKKRFFIRIDDNYIKSFGYTPVLKSN